MMRTAVRTSAATLLIVTFLAGCDNVQWGGADVVIVPPPPRVTTEEEREVRPGAERLPQGPILHYVRAGGGTATLTPVAEIDGDSLLPIRAAADWEVFGNRFISEHLREGAEFTLFRHGARAGTFVVQSAHVPDVTACPRLPVATGILELTAGAGETPEFLAMAKLHAPDVTHHVGIAVQPDQRMRTLAPILAERVILARGARRPDNWQRATAQIHPFPVADAPDAAFAATFLVGDTLGPGLDDEGHSTFFVAVPAAQTGYDTVFVRFTNYARDRKAAPRVVDFLDWNRDGRASLLLQVFGTNETWFEAVGPIGGEWRRIFEDRCVSPPDAAPPAPAEDAAGQPPAVAPAPAPATPPDQPQQQPTPAAPPGDPPAAQPDDPPAPTEPPTPRLLGRPVDTLP